MLFLRPQTTGRSFIASGRTVVGVEWRRGVTSRDGSSDDTILTNVNRLICHLVLSVDRGGRRKNVRRKANVRSTAAALKIELNGPKTMFIR